jgi:hypothetical protein
MTHIISTNSILEEIFFNEKHTGKVLIPNQTAIKIVQVKTEFSELQQQQHLPTFGKRLLNSLLLSAILVFFFIYLFYLFIYSKNN